MPRTDSRNDIDHFDDWDSFEMDDDIYAGVESDLLDDWEDDGAIAQVREPAPVAQTADVDEPTAEVFSLMDRATNKRSNELTELAGPSEDELSTIEEVGIDDYIDIVLAEDAKESSSIEVDESAEEELLAPLQAERNVESLETLPQTASDLDSLDEDDAEVDEVESDFSSNLKEDEVEEVMSFGEDEVELVLQPLFEGIAVSLPTLFDEDSEVEYKTTARLAKRLTESNVNAVFVGTSDGEGQTLSRKERKNLVRQIVKSTDSLVVADITAPSIMQSVQISNDCSDAGAEAFIITLDSSVRDPYTLCEAVHAAHSQAAIFVKLAGDAQSLPISPEFLYDLPISGVVDSTGDATFFLHLVSAYSGPVYIGSTSLVALGHLMGASGVVLPSVTINGDLVERAFNGDAAAQAELAMIERETGATNGRGSRSIKMALEAEFLVSSTMRD